VRKELDLRRLLTCVFQGNSHYTLSRDLTAGPAGVANQKPDGVSRGGGYKTPVPQEVLNTRIIFRVYAGMIFSPTDPQAHRKAIHY
jgi:hypothetical protein